MESSKSAQLASSGSGASREDEGVRQGEPSILIEDFYRDFDREEKYLQSAIELTDSYNATRWTSSKETRAAYQHLIREHSVKALGLDLRPIPVSRDTPNEAATPKEAKE